jgi:hypothetical protein
MEMSVDVVVNELLGNEDYELSISNYEELLTFREMLEEISAVLTDIQNTLLDKTISNEEHDRYVDDIFRYYPDYNPNLLDIAIMKVTSVLKPAHILVGLLSDPEYIIPEMEEEESHILPMLTDIIAMIERKLVTHREESLQELNTQIPRFNEALVTPALAKLNSALTPQQQSQTNGGKRRKTKNKKRRNQRRTRR